MHARFARTAALTAAALIAVAAAQSALPKLAVKPIYRVCFNQSEMDNPWRLAQTKSMQDEAKRLGWKLVFTNANGSAAKQVADVRSCIAQRVDAMSPTEREAELKRRQEQAEKEMAAAIEQYKAESEAAKARGEKPAEDELDADKSEGLNASQAGLLVLFLLVLFGWKSILFAILAAAMAYRTAAGSVWG